MTKKDSKAKKLQDFFPFVTISGLENKLYDAYIMFVFIPFIHWCETQVFKKFQNGSLTTEVPLAVCQAHRGLPVGFLLLRYSVLFTVESLSLLNLLFIS